MNYFLILVLITFFVSSFSVDGYAHPGSGMVNDSKGNIFYTDLRQVWKISSSWRRSVAVNGVRTHELYIDQQDNLYGEHLWHNGELVNTWGTYVWRLQANGKLDSVVPLHKGFLKNYSFCRYQEKNQYQIERNLDQIIKQTNYGMKSILTTGNFKQVKWLKVSPDGIVYFIDKQDLYKVEKNGHKILLARDLANKDHPDLQYYPRHSVLGIWLDPLQNIYVAAAGEGAVKKITQNGIVSELVCSKSPWIPVSGLFDHQGNLWIMECTMKNEVRVRKISASEFLGNDLSIKERRLNFWLFLFLLVPTVGYVLPLAKS